MDEVVVREIIGQFHGHTVHGEALEDFGPIVYFRSTPACMPKKS